MWFSVAYFLLFVSVTTQNAKSVLSCESGVESKMFYLIDCLQI